MSITTKDLARLCGVSRTTVSRALHGNGRINSETKERILRLAEELDYKPDLVARSLVKGSSLCIGLIVFDLRNQFFSEMINAIEHRAKRMGYLLNITLHEGDPNIERELITTLVGHRMDGLIISPAARTGEMEAFLSSLPVPVVAVGDGGLFEHVPCVGIDEVNAMADATRHVLSKGYRRLVLVLPPEPHVAESGGHGQRQQGFLDALEGRADVSYEVVSRPDFLSRALEILGEGGAKPAFVCSGDVFAFRILVGLEKHGYLPPRDYGLMGFDGFDFFRSRSPVLSTVYNPVTEMGEQAFGLMMDLINEKTVKDHILIPHEIMQGDTL